MFTPGMPTLSGVVGSIAGGSRAITVICDTDARLSEKRPGKSAIVIDASAIGVLCARTCKGALAGPPPAAPKAGAWKIFDIALLYRPLRWSLA